MVAARGLFVDGAGLITPNQANNPFSHSITSSIVSKRDNFGKEMPFYVTTQGKETPFQGHSIMVAYYVRCGRIVKETHEITLSYPNCYGKIQID